VTAPATAEQRHGARPLVQGARWVVVDGHAICSSCGGAVEPVGPDRWRHVSPGRRPAERSKWLSPTRAELLRCRTYDEFAARYPWAVRADAGGRFVTSEAQWEEGMSRLERYDAGLTALARRRRLDAGENPYRDLVAILAAPAPEPEDPLELIRVLAQPTYWGLPFGLAQVLRIADRRRELVQLCAWAIPTAEALDALARYSPLLDSGAGMGYWVALLQAAGVDVVAYDLAPPGADASNDYHHRRRRAWTEVQRASGVDAVRRHPDRTLVLGWPPYDDDASSYEPLRAYRGDVVIHIGELDGASGSVRFHRELALNWTVVEEVDLPHWPGLDDRVLVYRRNAVRRPHRQRDRCDECRRFLPTGSLGRCDACFERRPPALALRSGRHRAEYSSDVLDALHPAFRKALETSPQRLR
jgi:hypothetical protein